MLVGACLGVGQLLSKLPQFGLQGHNLLLQGGDMLVLKGEVGLNRWGGRRPNLGRQTRLLVHEMILAPNRHGLLCPNDDQMLATYQVSRKETYDTSTRRFTASWTESGFPT